MTYSSKTVPRDHQAIVPVKLLARPRTSTKIGDVFAYLCEMGTGKSKMILDEFGEMELAGQVQDLLVVAPAGSYRNWDRDKTDIEISEFNKHLSDDLRQRLWHRAWVSGGSTRHKLELSKFLEMPDERPRAFVVNYEALSAVADARNACRQFLAARDRRCMLVVDESTGIRNGDSQRTSFVMEIAQHAAVRRILTGLVSPKSPLDLYYQFAFLDYRILGYTSFWAFKARYTVQQQIDFRPGPKRVDASGNPIRARKSSVVVAFRNVEELNAKIAPWSYRVLKEDCLDLPPKIYQIRFVEQTAEQKRIYAEVRANAFAELDAGGFIAPTHKLQVVTRLHQVACGHAVDAATGEIRDVASKRVDSLMELLAEHSGKAVLWFTYHHEMEKAKRAIVKEYGVRSVAEFHGGNRSTRLADESRFLSDPECRFMLSTPQAGGKGNTWVVASLVVYCANSYDLEMRMQSEDRCHRDGLKHSVTYVDLMSVGTVEEKIVTSLRNKIDVAAEISGDSYREWLI